MMHWSDLPGYFDFAELYDERVAAATDNAVFVEVGVYYGRSLVYLAEAIRKSGKVVTLYGVDNFKNPSLAVVGKNMRDCGVDDLVHLLSGDSAESARDFADGSVDFVFIDADHAYEAVRRDIAAWRPKIKPGGVMAGHDRLREGVHRAVVEAFGHYEAVGELAWMVRL